MVVLHLLQGLLLLTQLQLRLQQLMQQQQQQSKMT
jgi:hypothetical protein